MRSRGPTHSRVTVSLMALLWLPGACADRASSPPAGSDQGAQTCSLEQHCAPTATGACCHTDVGHPNPCCPSIVHPTITYACEQATGRCLTFCNDCIPPGWAIEWPDGGR